jgi:hypothetical protein
MYFSVGKTIATMAQVGDKISKFNLKEDDEHSY